MSAAGNNTTITSFANDEFVKLLDQLQVARFSIFSFVWLLGIWGNIMVIITICTTKRLHSSSNYFIANLAVADMGAMCISMPMVVIGQVTDWPFGEIVCRFLNPLKDLFLHVSFITLTAIAIDRYIHTAYPFRPHISIYKVKLIIALIWLVDFLLVPLPMAFVMKVDKHPLNGFNVCMTKWSPEAQKISILVLAGFVFLSVFVTALAYLGVGVTMIRQRRRIKKRAQNMAKPEKASRRQLEKNAKTVKLMIVLVLAFWFTVLPLTFFGLLLELKVLVLTASEYVISLFIVLHLLFLQHCINPVILYVLCKEMRAGFTACMQQACCCFVKKNEGLPKRCSKSQSKKDSSSAECEQHPVDLAVNGTAKIYSINHDNQRGPTVQV